MRKIISLYLRKLIIIINFTLSNKTTLEMEIKTTLVRFTVSRKQVEKRTENAICFDINNDRVWIPFKKVNVYPTDSEDFLEIVMPRWVFVKTNLPLYFKADEFDHVSEY